MLATIRILCVLGLAAFGVSCGGGGGGAPPVTTPPPPPSADPLTITVDAGIKQLNFSWTELPDATHYRLLENPDGHSGFTQVGADIPAGTLSVSLAISVHMHDFVNALYIVQGCDAAGCTDSSEISVMNDMLSAIGYFKTSNTDAGDGFNHRIALSADGTTLAIGANYEDSNATGINGDQNDNSVNRSGAVYVFRFDGTDWIQQAYVKASNPDEFDRFGISIALSANGNTLAVSAQEDSNATGINGDQNDNSAATSGAVYVFRFDGTDWSQQAYIKTSNSDAGDNANPIGLSADGNTMALGALNEDSNATGINGDQNDNSVNRSGAAYVFRFDGTSWAQTAYLKASNAAAGDGFGESIALSADGATLAVGAIGEDSKATGINGDQSDDLADNAGAVYIFRFDGTDWSQQAYIKASNTDDGDGFGGGIRRFALSGDGATLAVGAPGEDSNATGIDGDQSDNSADGAGAVYVFRFDGTNWFQQAFVKASNTDAGDRFGERVALSSDGTVLAVSAQNEDSCAAGVGANQNGNSCPEAGAVYVYRFVGTDWAQAAFVKASNPDGGDEFGNATALSADGSTLAVGADGEASAATGINGDQTDNSADFAGAVYVY